MVEVVLLDNLTLLGSACRNNAERISSVLVNIGYAADQITKQSKEGEFQECSSLVVIIHAPFTAQF